MAISTFHGGRTITHLAGASEGARVDIEQDLEGVNRMAVNSTGVVSVEQLFGKPGFAGGHFAIGTYEDCSGVGAEGDEIRIQIAVGCDPVLFPPIDLTYTITASDVAGDEPEIEVRDNIVNMLNGDADFKKSWDASGVKDNGIVFIQAVVRAEVGDRGTLGDLAVTATGTTVVTLQSSRIVRENTETELARSIDDPRQGILGITGSISISPGALSNRIEVDALNGGSNDLTVNGSGTPVEFSIDADPDFDIFITEIRLHGVDSGIRFERFLGRNSALSNGITFEIASDNLPVQIDPIKTTDDIKSRFSSLGGFDLHVQSGGDHVLGAQTYGFISPLVIRKSGTFSPLPDDVFKIIVNDNLSQISTLFLTAIGFKRA